MAFLRKALHLKDYEVKVLRIGLLMSAHKACTNVDER